MIKYAAIFLMLLSNLMLARATEIQDYAWIRNSDRRVTGGDLLYVGSGVAGSIEDAEFLAQGDSLNKLNMECGGLPKGTKIFRRFTKNEASQFHSYAEAGVALEDCYELIKVAESMKGQFVSSTLQNKLHEYQERIGSGTFTTPAWAKHGFQKTSSMLTVPCSSDGPDSSTARTIALRKCNETATQVLSNGKNTLSGLACNPIENEVQEFKNNSYAWVLCQFSLKNIKTIPLISPLDRNAEDTGFEKNYGELESRTDSGEAENKSPVVSDTRQLLITVLPTKCDEIRIIGSNIRDLPCNENPINVFLFPNDIALVIKIKSYQDKRIELSNRNPASKKTSESITVHLEKE